MVEERGLEVGEKRGEMNYCRRVKQKGPDFFLYLSVRKTYGLACLFFTCTEKYALLFVIFRV